MSRESSVCIRASTVLRPAAPNRPEPEPGPTVHHPPPPTTTFISTPTVAPLPLPLTDHRRAAHGPDTVHPTFHPIRPPPSRASRRAPTPTPTPPRPAHDRDRIRNGTAQGPSARVTRDGAALVPQRLVSVLCPCPAPCRSCRSTARCPRPHAPRAGRPIPAPAAALRQVEAGRWSRDRRTAPHPTAPRRGSRRCSAPEHWPAPPSAARARGWIARARARARARADRAREPNFSGSPARIPSPAQPPRAQSPEPSPALVPWGGLRMGGPGRQPA